MTPAQTQSWILTAVCERFGVTKGGLLGDRRTQPIADARAMAVYLLRRMLPGMSYPDIADLLRWNSHATAISAEQRVTADPDFEMAAIELMADSPEQTHAIEGTQVADTASEAPAVEVPAMPQGAGDTPSPVAPSVQTPPRFAEHRDWVNEVVERIRQRCTVSETLHRATAQAAVDRENAPATVQGAKR